MGSYVCIDKGEENKTLESNSLSRGALERIISDMTTNVKEQLVKATKSYSILFVINDW